MSIVVAIKTKYGVVIGADKQSTIYHRIKQDGVNKLAKSKYSNTVIGTVGYLRDCNLVELKDDFVDYKDILDKTEIDFKYVSRDIVTNIFDYLRRNKRIITKDNIEFLESLFVFCTKDRIFKINIDGAVTESNDYIVVGCGDEMVTGYLEPIKESLNELSLEKAQEIIKTAINKACARDVFIGSDNLDIIILKEV